jgi:short-subunit dehydrogenase
MNGILSVAALVLATGASVGIGMFSYSELLLARGQHLEAIGRAVDRERVEERLQSITAHAIGVSACDASSRPVMIRFADGTVVDCSSPKVPQRKS